MPLASAELVPSEIDLPFQFRRRPIPLAPDLRPDWKIMMLLLILRLSSKGGKSSLTRLHVLNWAVRSEKHQAEFIATLESSKPLFSFKVRFEPAFSRAIDFAAASSLVEWVSGDRIKLTEQGTRWAAKAEEDKDLMVQERAFFSRIGKRITESQAKALLSGLGAS
jgi:hypothetical protein